MKLCCCDHAFPLLQVQLAEMEGLSLNSDKSSILLGEDGDNHSVDQLSPKETQVEACWDLNAYTSVLDLLPPSSERIISLPKNR